MDDERELREKARERIKNMAELTDGLRNHPEGMGAIMVELGALLIILAESAERSALRLEKLTKHLKYFTIALVVETLALLYFTFLLLKHP